MNTKRSSVAADGRLVLGLALALVLPACGGGGGGSPTGPPTGPPPPEVIEEASLAFGVVTNSQPTLGIGGGVYQFSAGGRVDISVDWTSPSNDVDVYFYRGTCAPLDGFNDRCEILGKADSTNSKPERLSVPNVAAGTYTMLIYNYGPGSDTVSYRIVLQR